MSLSKFVKMNTSGKYVFMLDSFNDEFLLNLGLFLDDNRDDLSWILDKFNDLKIKDFGGNMMHIKWDNSKVVIFNPLDENLDESAIEMNRHSFIQIVNSWQQALEMKAQEVVFLRDDGFITMIASYEDGPEFRKIFNYKVK